MKTSKVKHRMDGAAVSRAASYVYKVINDRVAMEACFGCEYLEQVPQPHRGIFLAIIDWQLRGGHEDEMPTFPEQLYGAFQNT